MVSGVLEVVDEGIDVLHDAFAKLQQHWRPCWLCKARLLASQCSAGHCMADRPSCACSTGVPGPVSSGEDSHMPNTNSKAAALGAKLVIGALKCLSGLRHEHRQNEKPLGDAKAPPVGKGSMPLLV